MESLLDDLESLLDEMFSEVTAIEVFGALLIFVLIWPAALLVGWLVRKVLLALSCRIGVATFAATCVQLVVALIGLAWALTVLNIGPGFVLVITIVVIAVVAVVAQPLVSNVAASFAVPFWVGDQIETHGTVGTVVDVTLRTTIIETLDHRKVHVPNREVLEAPVVVYTAFPQRRSSVEVGIAYGTDIDEVRTLLVDAILELDGVDADPSPEAKPLAFEDGTYRLCIRWWHDSDLRVADRTEGAVLARVKQALDGAGAPIPPPVAVFLTEAPEGTSGDVESDPGSPSYGVS